MLSKMITGYSNQVFDDTPTETLENKLANAGEVNHYIAMNFYKYWARKDLDTKEGFEMSASHPYTRRKLAMVYELEGIRLLGQLVDIKKLNLCKLSAESFIFIF